MPGYARPPGQGLERGEKLRPGGRGGTEAGGMKTRKLTPQALASLPCIHEGRTYVLHLERESAFDRPVVVKALRPGDGSPLHAKRLANEYALSAGIDSPRIRRALAEIRVGEHPALVLEYREEATLREEFVQTRRSLEENLEVAVAISGALDELHRLGLVHRNLTGDHILVTAARPFSATLIDLGSACRAGEEAVAETSDPEEVFAACISPERTGRTNRPVDQRSDLYSLGAVLYEVFTGRPVFSASDPSELIHCHLAQSPVPPREVDSGIPESVSTILLRLLAKDADERYQSAFGLRADLAICLDQLQQTGRVEAFPLGTADHRGVLQLSDRLVGREQELLGLKQAVRDAAAGHGRVVFVSGPTGVGKSALVDSLRRFVAGLGGIFVEGSYDGTQRHLPYAGLLQAFDEFVDLALTENTAKLADWKARILDTAGGNGRLLVDMLPRLELVIGPQPAALALGPAEAQHRFLRVFHSFIQALARVGQPLVLFLDNLQWADQASLHVLDLLLSDLDARPIAFVGAYRNDEVDAEHPLAPVVERLRPLKSFTRTIVLENLPLAATNDLVADALTVDVSAASPLAQLVMEKTNGNPLLVRQLLSSLSGEGLLRFDWEKRAWQWDAEAIRRKETTGGVARLMTERFETLPAETRGLLSLAACAGNRFTISDLVEIAGRAGGDIPGLLRPAVTAGLIRPGGAVRAPRVEATGSSAASESFEFSHDRVRQAAYALLPKKQRRQAHLRLGRLLLGRTPPSLLDDGIFLVVDQLNEGFQLLTSDGELLELADLNLRAGRKAKRAVAYQAAIRYLSMGVGLLPADRWTRRHELALALFVEAMEAEYLSANFDRAALLAKEVLAHTADLYTRIRVHECRILLHTAQNQDAEAIKAGLEALNELDLDLPSSPDEVAAGGAEWERQLAEKAGSVEALADLPRMSDARHLAAMRVMMQLPAPAHRAHREFLKAIVARMVLLAAEEGNSPMAADAYGWYGALHCTDPGGVDLGYRFGRLALEVLQRLPAPELEPKVCLLFHAQIRPWKENVRDCVGPLLDVYRRGLEAGDVESACLGAIHHCGYLFCTGAPLESVHRKQLEYIEAIERTRLPYQTYTVRMFGQLVENLRGNPADPRRLSGELFDETKLLPTWIKENNSLLVLRTLYCRMMLQYLFGDYAGAIESGRLAEAHAEAGHSYLYNAYQTFYYAMALLAQPSTAAFAAPLIDRFKQWAALAPFNFAHKLALLEAERARLKGENDRAMEHFKHAIRLSRENGYIQDEALAYEREAVFHQGVGREDLAAFSLRKAADAYRSWGANRKVRDMEQRLKAEGVSTPLDTVAILKASQTLSQEVRLGRLLEKLMGIVVESAGAERGILIQSAGGRLLVQARATRDGVETMQGTPAEASTDIAHSVLNYVARTQSHVVLGDAHRDRTYGTDPHVVEGRIRSLLCLPVVYQGKLSGILYLENSLAAEVFTAERLEVLRALAAQAAISIENAGLYADLEKKISALETAEGELRQYRDFLEDQVKARTAELSDANSRLLREIADRVEIQQALQQAHDQLEQRVSERTSELKAANARLLAEIEERKRTEEALRQSEQRFHAVFDQTFQLIGVLSVDGALLETNQAALTMIGTTAEEVVGKPFWLTPWWSHSPELQERIRLAVREAAGGRLLRLEVTHLAKTGQTRHVDFSIKPIVDSEGSVVQLIAEGRDITARKEAEEAFRLNAERIDALLQLNQMASATEAEIMEYAFQAAVRLTSSRLGYLAFVNDDETVLTMQLWSKEAMESCRVQNAPRVFRLETTGLWGEAVRQRRPIVTNDYEAANPWKRGMPEGHVRLKRHMNLPVIVGGKIVLVAGVGNKDGDYNDADVRQLTLLMEGMWRLIERKRAEEAIRRLNQELDERVKIRTAQLEAANKELESFSYSVSHDLRAPLRSIDGFSRILLEDYSDKIDAEGRENLRTVRSASQKMGQLIDDVLRLSRINRTEMRLSSVNLSEIAEVIAADLRKSGPERNVEFAIAPNCIVQGDAALLRIALDNVFSNAWKYTGKKDSARIEFGVKDDPAGPIYFVRDNGCGFDMTYSKKLFGAFQRLHSTQEFPGTGIGLASVRRVMDRHGGRVWIEGEVDRGATLYFTLPKMSSGA
ncbi:hypothetical protein DB347_15160 [Opitutaceae bacterium EW11]|nr:hypothetical protein DB347_15160 [Opitutaceae bacterium EW11]